MSEFAVSEVENNVLNRITEERWLSLAAELIRTGQPRAGNPLDPDLPGGEEEAIAMMVMEAQAAECRSTYESVRHRKML